MKKRGYLAVLTVFVFLVFFSVPVDSAITNNNKNNSLYYKADINLEESARGISKETEEVEYEGYIIEFKNPPIIEKELALDKEIQQIRKEKENLLEIGSFSDAEKKESEIDKKTGERERAISNYESELKTEHSAALNNIQGLIGKELPTLSPLRRIFDFLKKLFILSNRNTIIGKLLEVGGLRVTGFAVSESETEREFYYVFNGVVLDISDEEAEKIKQSEHVKNVYKNSKVKTLLDSSIPTMEIDSARNYAGLTGEGITIAVIDTGIDASHESLNDLDDNPLTNDPKVIGWKDYVNFEPKPYDDHGHGTHVAGIAAGTGGSAGIYRGVAPKAKLVGVKVLDDWGSGTFSDVIAGMEWAIQHKDEYNISVISMSLGASINSDGTTPVEIAADYAVASGINFVVAAGNSGPSANTVGIPASAFNVITVGAVDDDLKIASFSSRGPTKDGRIKPEISAVGVDVTSSTPENTYSEWSGTSMATPHVAGFVALLLQQNSSLNTSEIKSILTSTALDKGEVGPDNTYGYGVLNGLKTIFSIFPPQHEISISNVDFPIFLEIGIGEIIKAEVENLGTSNENIRIEFSVNNILQENITINILSKEKSQVNFSYTATAEGNYTLSVKALPVANESIITNNEKSKEIKALAIAGRVKAVVLESWGSKKVEYTIFDYLNENWMNYGNYAVELDYKTLNKEDITYQDINSTKADILIISNAWTNQHYGFLFAFSDDEIATIKQYVEEGHGLIGTAGTISEYSVNNAKLAELFGLKNKTGLWNSRNSGSWYAYDVLVDDDILTKNILNKYSPGIGKSVINLEFDETKDVVTVAKILEPEDLWKNIFISAYKPSLGTSIYFAGFPEYIYSSEDDEQFFYNAIVWTNKNIGSLTKDIALYNLSAPKKLALNTNSSISANVKNNGASSENVSVKLLVDGILKGIRNLSLSSKEEKTVNFNISFNELKTYNITLEAVPLKNETYTINNRVKSQILVPSVVLTGNNSEYGLDTNGNGLYDYIVVSVGVDVLGNGKYQVGADLESFLGAEIDSAYTGGEVSVGDKNITLKIPTNKINRIDLDGPYKIKNFELYFEGETLYEVEELLTTKAYKVEDFEIPSKFTRNFDDYGLDTNGNGLYDWLVIEAEVDIKSAGNYSVQGSLYYSWYWIGSAYNETYLDAGIHNVTLAFKGMDIRKEGYSGSYTLDYLTLYSIEDEWTEQDLVYDAYDTSYYNYRDFEGAADLYGYISYSALMLNEENSINVTIYNYGSEATKDGTAKLYYQKGWCNYQGGECSSLTLIESKNINIDVDDEYKTSFKFTPTEKDYYTFVLVLNATNEFSPENNIADASLEVKQRGADLYIGLAEIENLIVNESGNLTFGIRNNGIEATKNGTAKLYYQKGWCYYWGGECDNLTLIGTRSIYVEGNWGEKRESFFWTPAETGYLTIVLILNASNEINEEDNYYSMSTEVKPRGPDPSVEFAWINYERDYFVGEANNITILVENLGTETATNINVSLYKREFFETGEVSTLIGEKQISNLGAKETKEINISWAPNSAGQNELKVEIESDEDVYLGNNNRYTGLVASKNETDVSTNYLYISSRYAVVGEQEYIDVQLLNLGKEAQNIEVRVYDNGALFGNRVVDILGAGDYGYQSFYWTPSMNGSHTLKAEVVVSGDTNTSNNQREIIKYVYNGINVTFKIKDSQNNPISRLIFSDYIDGVYVEGEKSLILPNLIGTGEDFYFGVVNFIKGDDYYSSIRYNTGSESVPANIDITSEFYNKTTDRGIDYYAVLANEVSIPYQNNTLLLTLEKNYLTNLGLNLSESYNLFYCTDFNFGGKICNGVWKEAVIAYIYEWASELSIEAYTSEKAEAVALSESYRFDGSTTNLSAIAGNNITGFTIEKQIFGRIRFKDNVNITRFKANPDILNDNIRILNKKIILDTSNLPELQGKAASLLFRGVNFVNPKVLYNGAACPDSKCTSRIYNSVADTMEVNISGFSEFEIVEGEYCGDRTCQGSESCSSCVADCGSCTSPDNNGRDGSGGGDGGGAGNCTPQWGNCIWGPCTNKVQNWICVDLKKCGTNVGKPTQTKACFVEANCTDKDKDGYGMGPDCLGPDIDDNDPGVTNTQKSIEVEKGVTGLEKLKEKIIELGKNYWTYLVVLVLIIGIIVLFLLILFLIKRKRLNPENQLLITKAKNFIKKARAEKYSDREIRGMFKKEGWKKEDIDKIM